MGKTVHLLCHNYKKFRRYAQEFESSVTDFCDIYSFKHLVKEPTCYKNPVNQKCIDLMLTNRQSSFQNSCVTETGLSDFHRMTVAALISYFQKAEPKIISYRDFKIFPNDR